jgi:hypothetical protein
MFGFPYCGTVWRIQPLLCWWHRRNCLDSVHEHRSAKALKNSRCNLFLT